MDVDASRKTPSPPPSPLEPGSRIADYWSVGARWAIHGDVHFHGATSELECDVAAWRYQGSQPLPKFLDALDADRQRFTALVHPQICRTFDIGRIPNELTCYWVQESPGGVPLLQHLHERSVVVPDLTVHIALQIALGIDAIHRAGLVHGDLDPEFVKILGKDRVKLSWGGLAVRLEQAGLDTGRGPTRSLAEIAPETLRDRSIDPRSDVYSFAALLYRMLAGTSPFLVRRNGPPPGLDPSEALERLPSAVPPALTGPLTASLGRDPAKRPTMTEWIEALRVAERQLAPSPGKWRSEEAPRRGSETPAPVRTVPSAPPAPNGKSSNLRIDSTIGNVPRSGRTASPVMARRNGAGSPPPSPPPVSGGTVRPQGIAAGSVPQLPARVVRAPRGPSIASHLAATSLMALLVLGGVSIIATMMDAPAPATEIAEVPPTETVVPAIVTLATDPPGATVYEDEEVIGTTPMEVVLDARPRSEFREFRLELEGYASQSVRQPWVEENTLRQWVLTPETSRIVPVPVPVHVGPEWPLEVPSDDADETNVPDPRKER